MHMPSTQWTRISVLYLETAWTAGFFVDYSVQTKGLVDNDPLSTRGDSEKPLVTPHLRPMASKLLMLCTTTLARGFGWLMNQDHTFDWMRFINTCCWRKKPIFPKSLLLSVKQSTVVKFVMMLDILWGGVTSEGMGGGVRLDDGMCSGGKWESGGLDQSQRGLFWALIATTLLLIATYCVWQIHINHFLVMFKLRKLEISAHECYQKQK
jgi:hypothetical protein